MKFKDFKKRYGISQVNEHLKLNTKEYELVALPEESSYDEAIALLKRLCMRAATLDELSDWYDWDGATQIIAAGSITEFESKKFVPVLCTEHYCQPTGRDFEAECFAVKRLAMIDTGIAWKNAGYLLAIREL